MLLAVLVDIFVGSWYVLLLCGEGHGLGSGIEECTFSMISHVSPDLVGLKCPIIVAFQASEHILTYTPCCSVSCVCVLACVRVLLYIHAPWVLVDAYFRPLGQ